MKLGRNKTLDRWMLWGAATCLLVNLVACQSNSKPKTDLSHPSPKPGKITIISQPPGAVALLNGYERLGTTPLTLERPAFTRLDIHVVKKGYFIYRIQTLVESGKNRRFKAKLKPREGILTVNAGLVSGASITVDGKFRGKTPDRVSVEAGKEHLLVVSADGFQPYRTTVKLKGGEEKDIQAFLLPLKTKAHSGGWLTVKTDIPAELFINGVSLGQENLQKIPLPVGKYHLEAKSLEDKRKKSSVVVITKNKVKQARIIFGKK